MYNTILLLLITLTISYSSAHTIYDSISPITHSVLNKSYTINEEELTIVTLNKDIFNNKISDIFKLFKYFSEPFTFLYLVNTTKNYLNSDFQMSNIVVNSSGEIIALCLVKGFNNNELFLSKFVVKTSYQGFGIAEWMLYHTLVSAIGNGFKEMKLLTLTPSISNSKNTYSKAISFYESIGITFNSLKSRKSDQFPYLSGRLILTPKLLDLLETQFILKKNKIKIEMTKTPNNSA